MRSRKSGPPPKTAISWPYQIGIVRARKGVPHAKRTIFEPQQIVIVRFRKVPPTQQIGFPALNKLHRKVSKVVPHPKNRFPGLRKLASSGVEKWSPTPNDFCWRDGLKNLWGATPIFLFVGASEHSPISSVFGDLGRGGAIF